MAGLSNKKAIINRRDLIGVLTDMRASEPANRWADEAKLRIKHAHYWGFQEVRRRFLEEGESGRQVSAGLSYLHDQIIRVLFDFATEHLYPLPNPTDGERLGLMAIGGYGRGELAPYSDIDLVFLVPHKATPWSENVIEFILYALWDLGLKVGHAVRTPEECVRLSKEDITICTALLEGRFLWGDRSLYAETGKLFRRKIVDGNALDFVGLKLAERDARHAKLGDSRYVVEPNIKEGKGGLRDLQTLWWIAHYLYGGDEPRDMIETGVLSAHDFRQYRRAEGYLWTVRVAMHYLSGRGEERLGFDLQREISQMLRYRDSQTVSGVERFMRHYFLVVKQVGQLTRVFLAILEERQKKAPLLSRFTRRRQIKGFRVHQGFLSTVTPDDFKEDPARMLSAFQVADAHSLELHPDTLLQMKRHLKAISTKIRKDPAANADFMAVLCSANRAEQSLRLMNESGVLGRFVPDFGRVVALMQYDMYHHYTVDEHSIRAVGLLAKLEAGLLDMDHGVASRNMARLANRHVIYVAVFLHDIAKGRGGDHSVLGAEVAAKLCPRLGFTVGETETIQWLVRWHLLMSNTAFKRDLADPQSIADFVRAVKSPERLRLLHILTIVDIRAVGPGRWNAWKGQLLDELYFAAEEKLVSGHAVLALNDRLAAHTGIVRALLSDWDDAVFEAQSQRLKKTYWIAENAETTERNMRLMHQADADGQTIGVETRMVESQDMTRATVYTDDGPGVFARIVGAIAVTGGNIIEAKIHTTKDGKALDNFVLQTEEGFGAHGAAEAFDARAAHMADTIRQAFAGKIKPGERFDAKPLVRAQEDAFEIAPVVLVNNKASTRATVIEVNAKDRPGLLYDLVTCLSKAKLSVHSAHVATYGERAVDVFYVRDLLGDKIENKIRLRNLESKLLAAAKASVIPLPKNVNLERSA